MKEWCLQNPWMTFWIIVWSVFWFAMAADSMWVNWCNRKGTR